MDVLRFWQAAAGVGDAEHWLAAFTLDEVGMMVAMCPLKSGCSCLMLLWLLSPHIASGPNQDLPVFPGMNAGTFPAGQRGSARAQAWPAIVAAACIIKLRAVTVASSTSRAEGHIVLYAGCAHGQHTCLS